MNFCIMYGVLILDQYNLYVMLFTSSRRNVCNTVCTSELITSYVYNSKSYINQCHQEQSAVSVVRQPVQHDRLLVRCRVQGKNLHRALVYFQCGSSRSGESLVPIPVVRKRGQFPFQSSGREDSSHSSPRGRRPFQSRGRSSRSARSSEAVDERTKTRYRWGTDQAIGVNPVIRAREEPLGNQVQRHQGED